MLWLSASVAKRMYAARGTGRRLAPQNNMLHGDTHIDELHALRCQAAPRSVIDGAGGLRVQERLVVHVQCVGHEDDAHGDAAVTIDEAIGTLHRSDPMPRAGSASRPQHGSFIPLHTHTCSGYRTLCVVVCIKWRAQTRPRVPAAPACRRARLQAYRRGGPACGRARCQTTYQAWNKGVELNIRATPTVQNFLNCIPAASVVASHGDKNILHGETGAGAWWTRHGCQALERAREDCQQTLPWCVGVPLTVNTSRHQYNSGRNRLHTTLQQTPTCSDYPGTYDPIGYQML